MKYVIVLVLASVGMPVAASAQVPQMSPGPAHERLDFLLGEWQVASTMHFRDQVHASMDTTVVRWLPGGVWLEANSVMPNTPIGAMFGSARIGWDEQTQEYVRHWIDNQSTVVLTQRGKVTDDGTFDFRGSFEWVDGTIYYQRHQIMRLQGGGWKEIGYMGTDPNDLQPNHEGEATRIGTRP